MKHITRLDLAAMQVSMRLRNARRALFDMPRVVRGEASVRKKKFPKCDIEAFDRGSILARRCLSANHRGGSADNPRGYVIVAADYVSNSCGVRCLYQLCHDLNDRGFPSFMTGTGQTNPNLCAPLLTIGVAKQLCRLGWIVVYPESEFGNPLRAQRVVRWVLNRPGLLGGDEVFAGSEYVVNYSWAYERYIKNRIAGHLYMPMIDEALFFPTPNGEQRSSMVLYYVGKSTWKDGHVSPSAFEITRSSPDKPQLGKLFRSSSMLYCFDNSTILAYEAAMCGCPVVIIPDGTQTRNDLEVSELGLNGIAWGSDELERARATLPLLPQRYSLAKSEYNNQLGRFIADTQSLLPQ